MTAHDPRGAYEALAAHLKDTAALGQIAGLLSWDQEAMMPPKGAEQRSAQAGALAGVLHARRTDPRVPDWCAAAAEGRPTPHEAVTIARARDSHARATRVPAALATEIARKTALGQGIWAEARADSDFDAFAPTLTEIVALKREEAACLAADGEDPYDALLDDFERGAKAADIDATFARLRNGLVALRERIGDRGEAGPRLEGNWPDTVQIPLARKMVGLFGYDWDAGRLDLVTHPFCSGSFGDVRITTRVNPADPFDCLYSTLHETGHAVYEQRIDPTHAGLPVAEFASMGVHESQSRLFENQIGRSRAFTKAMHTAFHDAIGAPATAEDLYRAANRVTPGFIRTEADEVHYNLHIMMRFDLERDLIAGRLASADLEDAWNTRFAADFDRTVEDAAQGVLQDVHWSVGLFGYFPTYTLGNLYAAELAAALWRDIPDADDLMAAGTLAPLIDWLTERVHRPGALYPATDLIERATGRPPTESALLAYLDTEYGDLYP